MTDPLQHAYLALEHLPAEPAALERSDLPVLLAAVQGQIRLWKGYRGGLIQALADGDFDAMRHLLAMKPEMEVSCEVLRPYREQAEAMAEGGT